MKEISKAVFLSYNSVGEPGVYTDREIGRNGNRAIIVQFPRGQRWGAKVNGKDPVGQRQTLEEAESAEERQEMIAITDRRESLVRDLYAGFFEKATLDELDYVVIYVGAGGSEGAIQLAAQVDPAKVRFVLCDCNLSEKLSEIARFIKTTEVPYLVCECGGQRTMGMLVESFLETGIVGPRPVLVG